MRNELNLAALKEALVANYGDFFEACQVTGLSPMFVRTWMKDDADVREALENAEQVGSLRLESVAIKRGVHGVEEDVYYQGNVVGQTTKYSDGLLTTLMKGRLKDRYGDTSNTNVNLNIAQQLQIMPRAGSYEEWLVMRDVTPKVLEGVPAHEAAIELLPVPQHDPNMADIL